MDKNPTKCNIRNMHFDDMPEVIEAEHESLKFIAGDFTVLPTWALTEKDIRTLASVAKDLKEGTYASHMRVVEVNVTDKRPAKKVDSLSWVCAFFSYEEWPDAYGITNLIVSPHTNVEFVLNKIVEWLKNKADLSPKRRKIIHFVRDADEAGIRKILPAYKKFGFTIKLVPNYFDDGLQDCNKVDAWKCEYEAPLNLDGDGLGPQPKEALV